MPGIRVVYFDYGNVISRDQSRSLRSEMRELSGLDEETFETRYSRYRRPYDSGHISEQEYWRSILDDSSGLIPRNRIETLIGLDMKSWEEIDRDMIELARSLKERGLVVGILSNMPSVMDRYLEVNKEWYGLFHPKIISGNLRTAKPEPEIYAYAQKAAGYNPEEILFIDDREENVWAASEAGFEAYRFEGADDLRRRLLRDGLIED
jgi:putative hydrolase of the HAD superfamily